MEQKIEVAAHPLPDRWGVWPGVLDGPDIRVNETYRLTWDLYSAARDLLLASGKPNGVSELGAVVQACRGMWVGLQEFHRDVCRVVRTAPKTRAAYWAAAEIEAREKEIFDAELWERRLRKSEEIIAKGEADDVQGV